MPRTRPSRRRAFTLLELIVVVLVLGVLAAIAVPTFERVQEESVDRALSTTADAFARSVRAAAASDGSGGVVSEAHLASALSELPAGTAYVVPPESEVVFVLADRQVAVSVSDGAVSVSPPSPCAQASGGDSVYDIVVEGVSYRVHVFSAVGASTFTALCDVAVEFLVVGGGGGAGQGGGGGGGLVTGRTGVPAGANLVTVGAGGEAQSSVSIPGDDGEDSFFADVVAFGGGGGGQAYGTIRVGRDGGSGGGAGSMGVGLGPLGGLGVEGQGNDGGRQISGAAAGGGGGAAAPGEPGDNTYPARGGDGIPSSITGSVVFYAGGGQGGPYWARSFVHVDGSLGGGGTAPVASGRGSDGVDGLGGGGGGSNGSQASGLSLGGAGGSGVVVLRYPLP